MKSTTEPVSGTQGGHAEGQKISPSETQGTIVLAGKPNVGKSVLFGRLTGHYTSVSNYPGTTVDISHGVLFAEGRRFRVIDTPGMYSLVPMSEEERVAKDMLRETSARMIVQVADAKNLEQVLPLTMQLIDAGLPTVLVLNMMDEARSLGLRIDAEELQRRLGIPVLPATATTGEGVEELLALIGQCPEETTASETSLQTDHDQQPVIRYDGPIEEAIETLQHLLPRGNAFTSRTEAILLMKGDSAAFEHIEEEDPKTAEQVRELRNNLESEIGAKLPFALAVEERQRAAELARAVMQEHSPVRRFRDTLSNLTMRPATGLPLLLLVLYFGFYKFVGVFGAGTVVDFLEAHVFEEILNPFFTGIAEQTIPWPMLRQLFTGEYGILTMGLKYAVAIILPVVAFFFVIFSIIEDSGYLPRLAMLLDRVFKKVGLSGRAVIPMVLGLGCATMATMVTRTLGTKRERIIATLLLALAVPCSAQLGVMLALLSSTGAALWIWLTTVAVMFLVIGRAAAVLMPGKAPSFYMEIPPLRLPRIGNVLSKTYSRVIWYLKEIVPIFLIASALIWVGQITGLFQTLIALLSHPLRLMGLPAEAGTVFLFGFFRRDYGAAGLYELAADGLLSSAQITVAAVTLTLFLPCIAQFLMNIKERGIKTGLAISGIVLSISFGVGIALHQLFQLAEAL